MLDATPQVTNPEGHSPLVPIGIAVHHTASASLPFATIEDERRVIKAIDSMHADNGWGGFGYHVIVFATGRTYHCGRYDMSRAHVAKRNHELIGVVIHGDFTREHGTPLMFEGLRHALETIDPDGNLPVKGHRDWALPGQGTECPGNFLQEFQLWENAQTEPKQPPVTPIDIAHALHVAYTGFIRNDSTIVSDDDVRALRSLTAWYNNR